MDKGVWWATVQEVTNSWTQPEQLTHMVLYTYEVLDRFLNK